jgi:hypothetical protein
MFLCLQRKLDSGASILLDNSDNDGKCVPMILIIIIVYRPVLQPRHLPLFFANEFHHNIIKTIGYGDLDVKYKSTR